MISLHFWSSVSWYFCWDSKSWAHSVWDWGNLWGRRRGAPAAGVMSRVPRAHIRVLCPSRALLPQTRNGLNCRANCQSSSTGSSQGLHTPTPTKGSRAIPEAERQALGHAGAREGGEGRGWGYLSWSRRPCQAVRVWVVYSSIQSL